MRRLVASCDAGSYGEQRACLERFRALPLQPVHVLADAVMHSNAVMERNWILIIVELLWRPQVVVHYFSCGMILSARFDITRSMSSKGSSDS